MIDVQEEIDKAFRAGFNCAMDNITVYDDGEIDTEPRFSLDKAATEYINKRAMDNDDLWKSTTQQESGLFGVR